MRPDLIQKNRAEVARLRGENTAGVSGAALVKLLKLEREYDDYQAKNVKAMCRLADALGFQFQYLKPFTRFTHPLHA